jgi:hypothetical protein
MKKSTLNILFWLTLFSVAMGFMETAVVVYLRKIYYPDGFRFPLVPIDNSIVITEIIREAATLVMLVGAGIFTGRNRSEKFGFFLYSFAIWDIFYYVFLKVLLDWPASLLTWDVLFLIPVTWVGPIIGPVINSVTMILFALILTWFVDKKASVIINFREWIFLILGSLTVIVSYTLDYSRYMVEAFGFSVLVGDFTIVGKNANNGQSQAEVIAYAAKYVPVDFDWWIFVLGEVLILVGMVLIFQRERKEIL